MAGQGIALDNFAFQQLSGTARGQSNFVLHLVWEVTEDIPFRQTLLHIHPSTILVVDANQYLIHLVLLIGSTVNMEGTGISLWVPDRGGLDLYLFHNNIYIQFE